MLQTIMQQQQHYCGKNRRRERKAADLKFSWIFFFPKKLRQCFFFRENKLECSSSGFGSEKKEICLRVSDRNAFNTEKEKNGEGGKRKWRKMEREGGEKMERNGEGG